MSYSSMNLHSEYYIINEKSVCAIADFFRNTLTISVDHIPIFKGFLAEYDSFEGDMKEFAESKMNLEN